MTSDLEINTKTSSINYTFYSNRINYCIGTNELIINWVGADNGNCKFDETFTINGASATAYDGFVSHTSHEVNLVDGYSQQYKIDQRA